jgi:ComF family protein
VSLAATALRGLLDLVVPPLCLKCSAVVASSGALCAACFAGIDFLAGAACPVCGAPRAAGEGGGGQEAEAGPCALCRAQPPPWRRARAAFTYDDGSKALVLRFKHADRTEGAPAFARWMAQAGGDLLAEADLLVPVPLHRWRLFLRRYNQAALLALALGRYGGVAVAADTLVRRRRTPSQGTFDHAGRGRAGRLRNVRGAFALARPTAVAGRRVLLIDDVLTSGATAGECARVLLAGGAAAVDVLTLARVPPPG